MKMFNSILFTLLSTLSLASASMSVLDSALNYLGTYNNSFVRKEIPDVFNKSFDISIASSVMEEIPHKELAPMAKDVFRGHVSPQVVERWSALQADESFMMYYQVDKNFTFLTVKHDLDTDSFNVATASTNNVEFANSATLTSQWCHSDDFNYTYKPTMHINGTYAYDDIVKFYMYENIRNQYTNEDRKDMWFGPTKTVLDKSIFGKIPERTTKRFNHLTGKYELAGPWDAAAALLHTMAGILNFNISQLGKIVSNMTGSVVPVETCLGFDQFNTSVSTGKMECVNRSEVPNMVQDVCKEMFWATDDPDALAAQLDEFKYADNETWVMSHIDFSSFNVTHPQYARIWKSVDPDDSECTNWVVTIVRGTVKIAPDIFAKITQEEVGWGLWSETKVDMIYEPHVVTPADVMALDAFFRSIIQNNECDAMGVNATINGFPQIDCKRMRRVLRGLRASA